ncbi:MAG: D-alanine--D-alanine ligase [Desulfovibrionaceae bacterium]|nr:D-alanine--D-alanine ligase [Desulfovibrionaceae bacterium]
MSGPIRIAVVFGGKSPEHWISFKSALFVLLFLNRQRFQVTAIYVRQDGSFADGPAYLAAVAAFWRLNQVQLFTTRDDVGDWQAHLTAAALPPGQSFEAGLAEAHWDLLFPVFHGRYGEDGTFQGLAASLGLPCAGADLVGSTLGMDKVLTKQLAQAAGLAVAPYRELRRSDWLARPAELEADCLAQLGLPLFVKPARLGSSIGVGRATRADQLAAVLAAAFQYDHRVLVETEIHGSEMAVGVIGRGTDSQASVVVEYTMQPETFDYDSKYGLQAPEDIIPARLGPADTRRMQEFARQVFAAVGITGISRIDSFWSPAGPVLNEINTMPGLNPGSPFIRAWEASGLTKTALLDRIVDLALETR